MIQRVSYESTISGFDVMDSKAMDDDISHELQSKSSTTGYVYVGSSSINGLVTRKYKLFA